MWWVGVNNEEKKIILGNAIWTSHCSLNEPSVSRAWAVEGDTYIEEREWERRGKRCIVKKWNKTRRVEEWRRAARTAGTILVLIRSIVSCFVCLFLFFFCFFYTSNFHYRFFVSTVLISINRNKNYFRFFLCNTRNSKVKRLQAKGKKEIADNQT